MEKGSELPRFFPRAHLCWQQGIPLRAPIQEFLYQPAIIQHADECYKNPKATLDCRHPNHPKTQGCISLGNVSGIYLFGAGGEGGP